jgi:RNA polymerase primary sigma factor
MAQKTQTPAQETGEKLRRLAVDQGYVTIDQMNETLPEGVTPEQMDGFFILLSEMKVEVTDNHDEGRAKRARVTHSTAAPKQEEEPTPLRFDDPVRMYLREMGRVPLLNREGEIAIAKRIEEGELVVRRAVFRSAASLAELEAMAA